MSWSKELGAKRKSGILLTDPERRIRICSRLNQIGLWFSIIKRHLLNQRTRFSTPEEEIDYYNEHLAKPFRWNYTG